MPRAKRIFSPGGVWHLTHRCHDRKFLLKFERDRKRWRHWLFKARKKYNLSVLNYIVTSNHIHLLVRDNGNNIPKSMQLIAGRTAQEYNRRKCRRGAFWEDRYFATAIATDHHFIRCLVYIDLNMVRAGVVQHPDQWSVSGYHDIQQPRKRYRIIDLNALCELTGSLGLDTLRQNHRAWISHEIRQGAWARQPEWTESVAVGPESFRRNYST